MNMSLDNLDGEEESEEFPSQQCKKQSISRHTQPLKKDQLKKIDMFIDKIIKDCPDELSQLIAVLEARGFLIEKKGEDFFISDNSFKKSDSDGGGDDLDYLKKIIESNKLGKIQNGTIVINSEFQKEKLKKIFTYRYNFPEGYYGDCENANWDYFASRKHGFFIPVDSLDPFISRLVKAMSAAGSLTWFSCDGHFLWGSWNPRVRKGIDKSQKPFVCFSSTYDCIWFKVIFENLIVPSIRPLYKWDIKDREVIIQNSLDDIIGMSYEIQKVAAFLYGNRIILRDLKQCVVKKLKRDENFLKMIHDINSDKNGSKSYENKIFEFFNTQYNHCFPEKLNINVGELK